MSDILEKYNKHWNYFLSVIMHSIKKVLEEMFYKGEQFENNYYIKNLQI